MMKDQSNAYAGSITAAYAAQVTLSAMYAASGNTLSDQLKIVARLIGGGLTTPIYIVNHPDSFDTHVDQVVAGNTATGNHANILSKLSVAISAFQDDITLMGKASASISRPNWRLSRPSAKSLMWFCGSASSCASSPGSDRARPVG